MERKFSIVEALRFGFYTTLEHILFFLGILLTRTFILVTIVGLFMLITLFPYLYEIFGFLKQMEMGGMSMQEMITSLFAHGVPWVIIVSCIGLALVGSFVNVFFQLGFIKIALEFHDHETSTFKSLFSCGRLLWRGFVCNLLYNLLVAIGMVFLILPGIYFGVKYAFWPQLLVDQNTGILQTLRMSGEITQDSKWHLFSFFLILGLINWAASMFFGVALLLTIPASVLAIVYVYRKLLSLPMVR